MKKENKIDNSKIKISSLVFFNILGEIENNVRISENHTVMGRVNLAQKYQRKVYQIIEELREDYLRNYEKRKNNNSQKSNGCLGKSKRQ